MQRRLFEDLVLSRSGGSAARRAYSLPVSIGIHAAVIGVAVVLPMLAPDAVPAVTPQVVEVLRLPQAHAVDPSPRPEPRPPAPPPAQRHVGSMQLNTVPRHGAPPPPDEPTGYRELREGETEQPACLSSDCVVGPPIDNGPPGPGPGVGESSGAGPIVVRAGQEVVPPVKLKHVPPVYPELARRAGVQGTVVIECTINPAGRVVGAQILRGHPLLNDAALAAVEQWVYRPTQLNGVPVSVIMTVTATFILNR